MKLVKLLTTGMLVCLSAFPAWGANPVWLQGMTPDSHEITVYRSASCGCCKGWIEHLEAHHFVVTDVKVDDVNRFKQQFDVPTEAASCHTAVVDGIVIEGHVPAQDIKRLLADPGGVRLLTVPAMPAGTPGMDYAGAGKDPFRVFAVDNNNQVEVFQTYADY